ncbi:MAG TPA: hypothetical protein VHL11_16685 [Phototrophicaceae bacterium]|jgi:hypothetical protein|nr:hypothetical protein [Phototrophicaceae bacterium]
MKSPDLSLNFIVRSYFFVIVLLLTLTLLIAMILSLITTVNIQTESPLAYENLIFTVERGSHGFLDLLELVIGGVIGSLAATLQFSMNRPAKNDDDETDTEEVPKNNDEIQVPVTPGILSVNPRTVVLAYLGIVLILCLGVLLFIFFTTVTALNISMDQFADSRESIILSVLATFDQIVGGLVGLIEISVGGIIGALGATLNYVMVNH